jgi:hypothetical protein
MRIPTNIVVAVVVVTDGRIRWVVVRIAVGDTMFLQHEQHCCLSTCRLSFIHRRQERVYCSKRMNWMITIIMTPTGQGVGSMACLPPSVATLWFTRIEACITDPKTSCRQTNERPEGDADACRFSPDVHWSPITLREIWTDCSPKHTQFFLFS